MIVMLEGCDRTGKSTLAKMLSDEMGARLVHCSKPKTDDPFLEYLKMLVDVKSDEHVVFDRFYLGEYVYSKMWRDGCKITSEEFQILDSLASKHRAIVVHCIAAEEDILDRCAKDGEDLLKRDQISTCLSLFEEIINFTNLPTILYDSSNQSFNVPLFTLRPYWKL